MYTLMLKLPLFSRPCVYCHADQIDTGKFPLQEFGWPQFISGLLGYSYSSTNTDLVNTGTGQDLLSEDWIDSVTNVMINDFSSFEFAAFYPAEDPLVMMNPDFVTMMRVRQM